jgi:hypothetical protein
MLRLTIWKAKDCITWELMFLIVGICEHLRAWLVVFTWCFLLMLGIYGRHLTFGPQKALEKSDAAFKH